MINVKLIIKKVRKIKFISVKFWIVIHFGKNPIKGGSPPSDNRGIVSISFSIFLFVINLNIWFKLNILKVLNKTIIVKDRKE